MHQWWQLHSAVPKIQSECINIHILTSCSFFFLHPDKKFPEQAKWKKPSSKWNIQKQTKAVFLPQIRSVLTWRLTLFHCVFQVKREETQQQQELFDSAVEREKEREGEITFDVGMTGETMHCGDDFHTLTHSTHFRAGPSPCAHPGHSVSELMRCDAALLSCRNWFLATADKKEKKKKKTFCNQLLQQQQQVFNRPSSLLLLPCCCWAINKLQELEEHGCFCAHSSCQGALKWG